MTELIVAILVVLPLLLTFFLRSNAAMTFLSICAAAAVVNYSSDSLAKDLNNVAKNSISESTISLVVVGLLPLITLLITRRSVPKSHFWMQVLPALCAGGFLAILATPLLIESTTINFGDSKLWVNLQKFDAAIIGVGVAASLFMIWVKALKHQSKKKHSKL